MPPAPLSEPIFVDKPDGLSRLAARLAGEPRVAVDTESNSLYAYAEQVCLLQFTIPGADYLVDCLALQNPAPLAPLFADPGVEKVFHAAEYDLMTLKRDFDFEFEHIFDTYIACRTLGWKRTGLAGLLEAEFGVKQNKRYQRADWGRRPLPPELLDYARLDTHYLLALRDRLERELKAAGKHESAQEAFSWQTRVEPAEGHFDPEGFWKIGVRHGFGPRQMAVLRELYLFRDAHARRLDRPPFKVLTDNVLAAVVTARPKNLSDLSRLPGMTPRQTQRYGEGILQAARRGAKAPVPRRPRAPRVDEAIQERYERLHQWRKQTARLEGVESDVVLPRDILWRIAARAPRTPPELRPLMEPLAWRFQTYGDQILQALGSQPKAG